MKLYCAVDVMAGTAVRLTRGEFDNKTDHGDPVALAVSYVEQGAGHLHVVDLDAARIGLPVNREIILEVVRRCGVPVQVGGGARSFEDVARLLDEGVERVVIGTAAVEEPELVERLADKYPLRVAIGIDHRCAGTDEMVAVRGWEKTSAVTVGGLLERFASTELGAVIVTSIAKDGMMAGPDIAGLRSVLERTVHPVIASGGVSRAADLSALAEVSIDGGRSFEGAIVGRALASGALTVEEALAACIR
jgi:phosphoribosylformimino-5-aminoimidazole carboxamide ribotide isomerase